MNGTATKDKGALATEAWATLGNVSAEEVAAWLLKEKNVEVSLPTIRKVKPDSLKRGGGDKKDNGDEVTATQMRSVKESAGGLDGLDKLLSMLDVIEAAAAKVGGLEKLRAGIVTLQDLVS
jgi:hypothetical protein